MKICEGLRSYLRNLLEKTEGFGKSDLKHAIKKYRDQRVSNLSKMTSAGISSILFSCIVLLPTDSQNTKAAKKLT